MYLPSLTLCELLNVPHVITYYSVESIYCVYSNVDFVHQWVGLMMQELVIHKLQVDYFCSCTLLHTHIHTSSIHTFPQPFSLLTASMTCLHFHILMSPLYVKSFLFCRSVSGRPVSASDSSRRPPATHHPDEMWTRLWVQGGVWGRKILYANSHEKYLKIRGSNEWCLHA